MSEVKRVTLTTIGDVVKKGGGGGPFGALAAFESSSAPNPFGGGSTAFSGGGSSGNSTTTTGKDGRGERDSGAAKKHSTVRLELNLFEPTAESFPEFNFSKMIHEEQKRLKKAQKKQHEETNGFLSDPELDNDVARMARELERKYGSGTSYATKGKSARPAKLDYCDRGAGYDEEDSFIDNSEAYDELIPQEIETVGGGFYINSGQLEFKQLSNFERPEDALRMPKPKKRALSTTSESSDDDAEANEKKDHSESTASQQLSKQPLEKSAENSELPQKRLHLDEGAKVESVVVDSVDAAPDDEKSRLNGHVAKKQKIVDNGQVPARADVLDKAKPPSVEGKEKSNGVKTKAANSTGPEVTSSSVGVDGAKEETDASGVKLVKTTTVKDMLRAKRDSLRKMEQEKKGRSSGSSRVSSSEAEEDGDGGGDEEDEDEENDEEDDEDDEDDEYDEEEGGAGSDKNSNESGSEVDIDSDSESSHESNSEKEATAKGKVTQSTGPINGTVATDERPVVRAPEQQPAKERKPKKECKLPDDLPEALRKDVESLKELARVMGAGKLNYFDSKVADLLLQIDNGARSTAGTSVRNAIFRHLEAELSISRQSLQLKLKKIRIRKLESKAKSVLSRLEEAVTNVMPSIVAKFELECAKVNELRAAATAQANAAGCVQLNGDKSDTPLPSAQIRNPKKKFSWNEHMRGLLWELYSIRVELFGLMRPRNQTEDEFVTDYLRNRVLPLWPKGWIRFEDLHKELDRRKKALAKSQGNPGARDAGKKPVQHSSPLATSGTTIDLSHLGSNAVNGSSKSADVVGPPSRSATPSSVKSVGSGKGMDVEKIAASSNSYQPSHPGASISPNASSKRTSDHSIINIMNSPPLPPPSGQKQPMDHRHSLDMVDQSQTPLFSNSDALRDSAAFKRSSVPSTEGSANVSPVEKKQSQLPTPDRPRWNSREDDSDSSIEIIAEYSMGGTAGHSNVPLSGKSPLLPAIGQTSSPGSGTTNLPVLNKEKYKNLMSGKSKTHGGSGSSTGSSPVRVMDVLPNTTPMMGSGKFAKHSPTVSSINLMTGGASGSPGVIGFAPPAGNLNSGGGMMQSDMSSAGGSVRLKDAPSPLDVDVHQIMKDLKEFQKQHNVGNSRKPDTSTLQSQPQHEPTATTASLASDYFLDCDMDEDDFLFATNYTYGGRKN
ncbi:ubinuclein-2 [Anopheles nili]|uniref:ubinuclein-2 n=1 Tax=Anopheles nili TaxID=185578 RepID=UPI00237A203B|nr:ubinuclein-2 [Anopheles nili]